MPFGNGGFFSVYLICMTVFYVFQCPLREAARRGSGRWQCGRSPWPWRPKPGTASPELYRDPTTAPGPTHTREKLHQLFQSTRAELENILAGYSLPEPYFRPKLQESIERLMKCLRDPALPLLELQVHISTRLWTLFLLSALSQSNINILLNCIWFMLSIWQCTGTCIKGIFSLSLYFSLFLYRQPIKYYYYLAKFYLN